MLQMTCKNTSCKYEFCWVCSGPWKDHSGSYYNCNKYDPEKEKETADGKKKVAAAGPCPETVAGTVVPLTIETSHAVPLKVDEMVGVVAVPGKTVVLKDVDAADFETKYEKQLRRQKQRDDLAETPVIKSIFETFPGAEIESIRPAGQRDEEPSQ